MKVVSKQRNSKMCMICGLDNEYGVNAPFYNMEDGSVMTLFHYKRQHQSYPGRVHGGLITAMLDEMGLRSLWAKELSEEKFGVTLSLDTKYRKPVPYETELIGRGIVTRENSKFIVTDACIMDVYGNVLANGEIKYIKMDTGQIAEGIEIHEEMPYLIEDDVKEIVFG
ncbi:MAG: PaaI family thioesterase [Lachnospiraceae bacterium]|nr:PaaI family thioesterase [Lachnospiraceae bacterium]